MATYPASNDVVSGTPILASQMNNLRKDAVYGGQSPGDAISLISLLRRFSQNVRLQYLATNKVRVPFAADKPPCLIVGDYMLAATANVDSAAITGTAGPRYVLAQRTAGSNSFTLVISVSNVEGADQRLIGELYFDGTSVKQASIKSYEMERQGYVYAGNETQKSPAPAQGEIFIALDSSSIYVSFIAGTWTRIGGGVFGVNGNGYQYTSNVTVNGPSSSGMYGSYVEIYSSAPKDRYAFQWKITNTDPSNPTTVAFQIAVGPSGFEVPLGEWSASLSGNGSSQQTFLIPLAFLAGQRITVRTKHTFGGLSINFTFSLTFVDKADMV